MFGPSKMSGLKFQICNVFFFNIQDGQKSLENLNIRINQPVELVRINILSAETKTVVPYHLPTRSHIKRS